MKTIKKEYYCYEVIYPIKDYGYNKKVGDLMTLREIQELPSYYKKCVRDLPSPILK
jgi:hypothetical protein